MHSSNEVYLTLPYNIKQSTHSIYSAFYTDTYRLYTELISSVYDLKSVPMDLMVLALAPHLLIIPVDIVVPGMPKSEITDLFIIEQNILKHINNVKIYSAGMHSSLQAMTKAFFKLWNAGAIYIDTKPVPWCKHCNTTLTLGEVQNITISKKMLYIKLEIDNNRFFICRDVDDAVHNMRAVLINPQEDFVVMTFGPEIWILPEHVVDDVVNKVGIFTTMFRHAKGAEIAEYFKKIPIIQNNQVHSGIIAPNISLQQYNLLKNGSSEKFTPTFDVIYSELVSSKIPVCKFCNNTIIYKAVEGVYLKPAPLNFQVIPKSAHKMLNFSNLLISSNLNTMPKMPVLHCDQCGRTTLGQEETSCSCGGTLLQKYRFDPYFLTLGIFYLLKSTKNIGAMFHNESTLRNTLLTSFTHLRMQYFSKLKILNVNVPALETLESRYDLNAIRLAILNKDHNTLTDLDLTLAERYIKRLKNLIKYAEIYGTREVQSQDRWLFSRLERMKKRYSEHMESVEYKRAFKQLQNFVYYDISRLYLKMHRYEPIPKALIYEIATLSYPFIPKFVKQLEKSLNLGELKLKLGKYEINATAEQQIQQLFDLIKQLRALRAEHNIPLRMPLRRLVIVTKNDKTLSFLNVYRNTLAKMLNILKIDPMKEWNEIVLKVEPNRELIGNIYTDWKAKITDLLHSRNPIKVKESIEKGDYVVAVEGALIKITPEMVSFVMKSPPEYTEFDTPFGKGYLWTEKDEYAKRLYLLNSIIKAIKTMRKDIMMEFDDYIDLTITDNSDIRALLEAHKDIFSTKVKYMTLRFSNTNEEAYVVEWTFGKYTIEIGITPLFKKDVIHAFLNISGIAENIAHRLFNAGITSVYHLMQSSEKELMNIEGIDSITAKKISRYLTTHAQFQVLKIQDQYQCPLCNTAVELNESYCPRCLAPLDWENIT